MIKSPSIIQRKSSLKSLSDSSIISYNNSIEDITDIIKCILKSDLIKTAFEKIKESFKSKDISETINTGIYLFNEF